jgi:hypothetical protein
MNKEKFKELQSYWYSLLEKAGFKDQEILIGEELILKRPPFHYRNTQIKRKELQEEYYKMMSEHALDETTQFSNQIDKYIILRHIEGVKQKQIVQELLECGTPKSRRSVRVIIRRYEMRWGIRYYTPEQLNKYCKK